MANRIYVLIFIGEGESSVSLKPLPLTIKRRARLIFMVLDAAQV